MWPALATCVQSLYPPSTALPAADLEAALQDAKHHVATLRDRNDPVPLFDALTNVAQHFVKPEFWALGHIGQSLHEARTLSELAVRHRSELHNICEIGLNAGHSAALWLSLTSARLQSFDTFGLPHSVGSRGFIQALFPGRVDFHAGDSRKTLKAYADQVQSGAARPCDLSFIDGNHNHGFPGPDMKHAINASRIGSLIVADDATVKFPAVLLVWKKLTEVTKQVQPLDCHAQAVCMLRNRSFVACDPKLGLRACQSSLESTADTCFSKRWCVGRLVSFTRLTSPYGRG